MKIKFRFGCALIMATLLAASCERSGRKKDARSYSQEELFEANRNKVSLESGMISSYLDKSNFEMEQTPTGLRYNVYSKGTGDSAKTGMLAIVTYNVFLLDSTKVASTDVSGPRIFRIGQDDMISGLHEAVALLHVGDSARLLIPSHLAYGLTGQENIPPNAALYYDLSLVDLR